MINQNRTWTLRWKIVALLAVFLLGAATLTDAQEKKRPAAEIRADIEKLLDELQESESEPRPEGCVFDVETTLVAHELDYKALVEMRERRERNAVERAEEKPKAARLFSEVPTAFPLIHFAGVYKGTEGKNPIEVHCGIVGARIDNAEGMTPGSVLRYDDGTAFRPFDSLFVRIYEGGYGDRKDWQDNVYTGRLHLVDLDKLELRLNSYRSEGKNTDIPEGLKKLPVKMHREGNKMTLEIPKNEKWETIRVTTEKSMLPVTALDNLVWDTIGIRYMPIPQQEFGRKYKKFLSEFPEGGVYVWNVRSDSPAAKANIKTGDVIVGIGPWVTSSSNDVRYVAQSWKRLQSKGESISATIIRGETHYKTEIPTFLKSLTVQGTPSQIAAVEALIKEQTKTESTATEGRHPTAVVGASATADRSPAERHVFTNPSAEYRTLMSGGQQPTIALTPEEEPTFAAYPLVMDADITMHIIRFMCKQAHVVIDKQFNLLLVSGSKTDHENIKTLFAKLPEGEECVVNVDGKETVVATIPQEAAVQVLMSFLRVSAPQALIFNDHKANRFIVIGSKSDHEKVKAMFEQIRKAKEEAKTAEE